MTSSRPETRAVLFDHIALAMPRMRDALDVLVAELGGAPHHGGDSGAYRFAQWRFANGGRLEVLEPAGPANGFLHRFLARHGPSIHHVTFRVPSLNEACERAVGHGYEIVGHDASSEWWKEAFLHPRQAQGIVVQLAQMRDGGGARLSDVPTGPAPAAPPVSVLGLRMRARSRERAAIQWEGVLQGSREDGTGGELVYRWPGAPLRLVIEIDPDAPEGPVCIELAGERALRLPSGPHPVLGAVLRQAGER